MEIGLFLLIRLKFLQEKIKRIDIKKINQLNKDLKKKVLTDIKNIFKKKNLRA